MATFKSATHPALTIVTEKATVKFRGGQLDATDEQAEAVRAFAKKFPQYNIEEAAAADAATSDASTDDGEDSEEGQGSGPTNAQLREELAARGLPTTGNKAELLERLAASDDDEDGDANEDDGA